jgi:hypothetical protein
MITYLTTMWWRFLPFCSILILVLDSIPFCLCYLVTVSFLFLGFIIFCSYLTRSKCIHGHSNTLDYLLFSATLYIVCPMR